MNNKISNPLLKQLISEIANKANEGRITNISWGVIDEAKKKKALTKEANEKKPTNDKEKPTNKTTLDTAQDFEKEKVGVPNLDADPKKGADDAATEPSEKTSPEDPEKAKEDASKAKAELEKAKAEKAAAEKELEQHKYVKLSSGGGIKFLLGKAVEHAFKAGEIDSLAGEMVDKLKIKTPDDMSSFSEDVVTYMSIPGMPELIDSMRTMATEQPETPTGQ